MLGVGSFRVFSFFKTKFGRQNLILIKSIKVMRPPPPPPPMVKFLLPQTKSCRFHSTPKEQEVWLNMGQVCDYFVFVLNLDHAICR